MKLVILGSTCAIGKILTAKALEKGHEVNVLVRDPNKLGNLAENLNVIQGDYFDSTKVRDAIVGTKAVLSAIGPSTRKTPDSAPDKYESAMKNLIEAMEDENMKRIIVILGAGISYPDEAIQLSRKFMRFMMCMAAKHILCAKQKELALLMKSKLIWTAVRPPMIKETSGQLMVDENKMASMKVDVNQLADCKHAVIHVFSI